MAKKGKPGKREPKRDKSPVTKSSKQESKAKKKPSTQAEMKRFARRGPPDAIQEALVEQFPMLVPGCGPAVQALNDALNQGCALRSEFTVESHRGCVGGGVGGPVLVDLVILIDTSGSMVDEATDLSDAAAAAIKFAREKCPSDLRVCWFGIEGTWVDTRFTQSYRNFLLGQAPPNPEDCSYSKTPVTDGLAGYAGDREDGAAAISDLAEHFDWRPGATRAVFYLDDEALERGGPQDANDYAAANDAIAAAQQWGVTVFTYFGSPFYPESAAETSAEYRRLAIETGGQFFNSPPDNLGGFQAILEQIICAAGQGPCRQVDVPKIRPCFRLMWGDGPDDRIETDDVELMCLTAVNPYSNVTLKNLNVLITLVTEEDGTRVADLPDRTASVYTKPLYLMCFGDIPPCNPEEPESVSSVSREIVLVSRGAKEGKYLLNIGYCYSIEFTLLDLDWFEIELVKS